MDQTQQTKAGQAQPRAWRWPLLGAALLVCIGVVVVVVWPRAGDSRRMVLWHLVHDQCVPHALAGPAPAPCLSVDLAKGESAGSAVLKDRNGVAQVLLIPTHPVAGIESPEILAPDAPNYFAAAWAARTEVSKRLPRALQPDEVGLAINASTARSQDQLHIHVDCLRADVRDALRHLRNREGPLPAQIKLAGTAYDLFSIPMADLARTNVFAFVREKAAGAKDNMGQMTIALVGGTVDGWVLASQANMFSPASGHSEDVQDHACTLAQP